MSTRKIIPIRHQTKTQLLSAQLAKLAQQLGPDARLPTMHELCDAFEVSGMTMNRALSELEAQGVLIRRQGSGTYVAPARNQRTIGLVCDRDIFAAGASPFLRLLVAEARRRADELDEKFSFFLAEPGSGQSVHEDLMDAVATRKISGALFVGEQNPAAVQWLEERVPLVALSYSPGASHRVQIDHAEIVRSGVEALASAGCRRIALWIPVGVGIGRAGARKSFPELEAYRSALKTAALPYEPELVWRLDELSDKLSLLPHESNQEQGLRAARAVFSKASRLPDGIVVDDDMMTRGALTALEGLRLRLGKDVRIASHTNSGSDVLLGYEDRLTLLEIDPVEIVAAMFAQLELLLKRQPALPVVTVGLRRSQR